MVFNKRRSLYGLHASRTECRARGTVFIVEGYFDLLALHQNKITHSVATLGTALTTEHVQILRRGFIGETGHIVLVYDSDEAGITAAERSIEVFTKGFAGDARILVLPKGHDPDSFLLQFGPGAFLERASQSLAILPFLMDAAIKRHGLSTDGKIRIVSELKSALAAVEDGMARSLHVRDLAERIGVAEAAVMEKVKAAHSDKVFSKDRSQLAGHPAGGGAAAVPEKGNRMSPKTNRMEHHIISMMFQFPGILAEIRNRGLLYLFEDVELKTIGERILDRSAFDPEKTQSLAADIMASLENADTRDLAASLAIGDEPWDHNGCLKFIDQFEGNRKREDKNILKRIRAAETAGDRDLLTRLQRQLLKEKKSLAGR
jgi:DNA primase